MVSVDNINVPPENRDLWDKSCVIKDSFNKTRVEKKHVVYRKRNFTSLIARSNLTSIALQWNNMSPAQRLVWEQAGYWNKSTGWDLFVQDTSYRLANNIPGTASPSVYHQFKVGKISVDSPADHFLLSQNIPIGSSKEFEFECNWKSELYQTNAYHIARIAVYIVTLENGYFVYNHDIIDVEDNDGWQYYNEIYDYTGKEIISMQVFMQALYMRGNLYLDGFSFYVDEVDQIADWQFNNFDLNWNKDDFPAGVTLASIYP